MSEEVIIRQCSPTLAGLKTGSMFRTPFEDEEKMRKSVRYWNGVLKKKGLRVVPLEYRDGMALVYFYRPGKLSRDLSDEAAKGLLKKLGYSMTTPERCIYDLKRKIGSGSAFPHEVGLFLGYPPEDVFGFIEKGACGSKCTGCWRVYGDVGVAERTFAKYRKCSEVYMRHWKMGKSVEKLTVSV